MVAVGSVIGIEILAVEFVSELNTIPSRKRPRIPRPRRGGSVQGDPVTAAPAAVVESSRRRSTKSGNSASPVLQAPQRARLSNASAAEASTDAPASLEAIGGHRQT